MGLAEISLIALAVAVVIGIVRNVNVGPLSLAIALVIGYYIGGVKIRDLIAGYPVNVFLMLAGITYLFAIANINGTLVKLTNYAVQGVRGNVAMIPIILFLVAFATVVARARGHHDLRPDGGPLHDAGLADEDPGLPHGRHGGQRHPGGEHVAHCRRRRHREGFGARN